MNNITNFKSATVKDYWNKIKHQINNLRLLILNFNLKSDIFRHSVYQLVYLLCFLLHVGNIYKLNRWVDWLHATSSNILFFCVNQIKTMLYYFSFYLENYSHQIIPPIYFFPITHKLYNRTHSSFSAKMRNIGIKNR